MILDLLLYAMIGIGALLVLIRLALGPSLLDRVVATDTLLIIISAGLAVHAALSRNPTVVPVLVVVAMLAFVGTVSVARYIGGMLLVSSSDPGSEQRPEQAGEPPEPEPQVPESRAVESRAAGPDGATGPSPAEDGTVR